jgi:L-alanine-DL-glutamate epimerase-like enolase superfamily enzyme
VLPLAGDWTIDSLSHHLESLPLFAEPPEREVYVDYRRWAFESAALDLALRQAGISLGGAVGREPQPVTFVASGGLGDPPSTERLRAFLGLYPTLRFKLDARPDWTEEIYDELRRLQCVDSVDLKGQYSGTVVDNPPDPALYARVLEEFPEAWIEDPALTPETIPLLEPHADRVTWDAVIHSVADIAALRWPPRTVNVKPSRFGSIERLFAAYDYCEAHGIGAYGGGQWELGIGRGHIQLLAALFHPDTPNDVAPVGYNATEPVPGLPTSPLAVTARATGFLGET